LGKATLSITTDVFPPDEIVDCLEFCAKLGLAGVELGPHIGKEEKSASLATLKGAFARLPLRPLSVHSWTQVEGLEEVCEFARDLGAGLIVVHCRHEKITGDFENQIEMLRRHDGWCRENGIVVAVENSSVQPLEPFVRLFEALPELRMTLDVKHAYKPETLGLTHVDYMRELGDRPANFHISGIDRARELLGDGCPPGNDAISWTGLAEDLAAREYSGLITAEVILPKYLSPQEREEAYFDLPPASNELPTLSHRLMKHSADYYREALAACLAPGEE
jgi:sugar phosphate isomerase/epimerase